MVGRFFRAKALRFRANGGGACGYRIPLESAIVGSLAGLGLRVKTLNLFGLDGDKLCRYPLEGIVVEFRFPSGMFWCLRWQIWCSICFYFSLYLICFVKGFLSSCCIGSAVEIYL